MAGITAPTLPAMNQSTIIFAYLAFAFLIFITVRGELRTYMGFLLAPSATPATTAAASSSANAQKALDAGKIALQIGELLL